MKDFEDKSLEVLLTCTTYFFPWQTTPLRQKGMRPAIPRIMEKEKKENVVRQEEKKLPKLYLKILSSDTSQEMVRKDYI